MNTFKEGDIAIIEHEMIAGIEILDIEDDPKWGFYIAGVHDMADKIIRRIREQAGDVIGESQ